MSRWIRVGLKREVLRTHLSQADRSPLSHSQVEQWLRDAGFRHYGGDEWLVLEADLGQLDPSEVASVEVECLQETNCRSGPAAPPLPA